MFDITVKAYLYLDILIRILFVFVLISWIVVPIYAMRIDSKKKKELEKLRELNHQIDLIMSMPIKKAREFLKTGKEKENG